MKDRLFQIWLALRCGAANREFVRLLDQYGSPYEIFSADEEEIAGMPCSDELKQRLLDKSLEECYHIQTFCQTQGIGIAFYQDEIYPDCLRVLLDPPVLLYYKGKLPDFSATLCVGVVGTRTMSEYGKRMAYKIGYELASAGAVVVSGMALGIDSVAATAAMAAGGTTIAVLGSGIDVIYPAAHKNVMAEIARRGAVITEYPPHTEPIGSHFPVRNRLISGLSHATVVVEANRRSGALLTARHAIMQGKGIFAVPGMVGDDNASGTNQLIRDGAAVVLGGRDLLAAYAAEFPRTLHMNKLRQAEMKSGVNEDRLSDLGVRARAWSPTQETSETTDARPTQPAAAAKPRPERSVPRIKRETPKPEASPVVESCPTPAVGDRSAELVRTLSDTQRKIFELFPFDRSVSIDRFVAEGFGYGEILAAMTILEVKGLIVSLPGGLYTRK
jgi:DNA processing protein